MGFSCPTPATNNKEVSELERRCRRCNTASTTALEYRDGTDVPLCPGQQRPSTGHGTGLQLGCVVSRVPLRERSPQRIVTVARKSGHSPRVARSPLGLSSVFRSLLLVQLLSQSRKTCCFPTWHGSGLGPLLFLIYINNYPLNVSGCSCILADYCLIFRSITGIDDHQAAQNNLSFSCDWCDTWLMTLNVSKCHAISFSRKQDSSRFCITSMKELLRGVSSKYLCVHLTDNLSWSTHVKAMCAKASNTIGYFRFHPPVFASCPIRNLFTRNLSRLVVPHILII